MGMGNCQIRGNDFGQGQFFFTNIYNGDEFHNWGGGRDLLGHQRCLGEWGGDLLGHHRCL